MSTKIRVWDLPVRVFHWLLAASFIAAYLIAESEDLRGWHVILGYTTMGLIAFRIVWGLVGSRFARFRSFLFSPAAAISYGRSLFTQDRQEYLGHNPLGSYAIYAILLIGLATGLTGYLRLNETGGDLAEDLHEIFANIWLGIVILHVAGVMVGSWVHRENLAWAMITGYKEAVHGGSESKNVSGNGPGLLAGRVVGLGVVIAVAAFWVWAYATGYQPGERTAREHSQESQTAEPQSRDRPSRSETRRSEGAERD